METINSHLTDIANLISGLIGSIFLNGLIGAVLGLVIGIIAIVKCRKMGVFNRTNGLWSFVAKCNYVLLPIALLLIGMTQGGIYGAHNTAEEWIEKTTTPIIDYAESYLPQLQSFVNQNILNEPGSVGSIKEAVIAHNPSAANGLKGSVMTSFNVFLLSSFLDVASPKTTGEMAEPLILLSQVDLRKLDRNVFEILPAGMRAATSFYFAGIYWVCFAPFGMYLLVMLSEIALFRFITGLTSNESLGMDYSASQQVEFV